MRTSSFSALICLLAMSMVSLCFSRSGHCANETEYHLISKPVGPAMVRSGYGPRLTANPGYRVIVAPILNQAEVPFPDPATSWDITYVYTVPPLPTGTWNYTNQTFYIWGDLDFDEYGSSGSYPISSYLYNQIVPELILGDVLSGNDAGYHPSWQTLPTWYVQATYFWQNKNGTFYAQTGNLVPVEPGDTIYTIYAYDSTNGSITTSIFSKLFSDSGTKSTITIPRPFPNETNPPFSSWKDFFTKALANSPQLLVNSEANVETAAVDQQTVCSLLPWTISEISIPSIPVTHTSFQTYPYNGLSCQGPIATLNF